MRFSCASSLWKNAWKALLAFQGKEIIPIHNLRLLAETASIINQLEDSTLVKLDYLSNYYINARYKEDLQQLSKGIGEGVVRDFIAFSEEQIAWLQKKMK
jgi:hypothetical protein